MEKAFIAILLVVGGVVLMVPLAFVYGWVLTMFWAWFVVPTFGVPMLGIWPAVGINLLLGLVTRQANQCHADDMRDSNEKLSAAIVQLIWPLVVLGFGWIIWQFSLMAG